jgi:FliI/YscN family ATPase
MSVIDFASGFSLARYRDQIDAVDPLPMVGQVVRTVGLLVESKGPRVRVGELCELASPGGGPPLMLEVVGFRDNLLQSVPLGSTTGIRPGDYLVSRGRPAAVPVGTQLLGRVIDGLCRPLDDLGPLGTSETGPLHPPPMNPLARQPIEVPMGTGVRAIDALLTVGRGQRVGLFGGSGVGKSTLLGMMAKGTSADVAVIALVGERGREVRSFLEHDLGAEGLKRSVVIVSTSDNPPLVRLRAAYHATTVAEYFRAQGQNVLLMMDSVTRFAMAQREIGLAAGEPPARQGFPPSVFSALPQLMERGGCGAVGSITAFYTVLAEGEVGTDPVADEVRATLDGHLVLSPKIAQRGQFPAIDMLQSLSRLMPLMADPAHQAAARRLRALLHKYDEIEMLVQLGEYRARSDPDADEALARMPEIRRFLAQRTDEATPADEAIAQLTRLVGAVQ